MNRYPGVQLTPLGIAIKSNVVPDTATPEFHALNYMAHMIHDKRIPKVVKEEIAAVLLPCLAPMVEPRPGD
jgi:hypothetical protein